jgi:hypothetical protein
MAKTPSKQSAKKAAPAKKVREIGRFNNNIIIIIVFVVVA